MQFKDMIDRITPEVYANLKQALELGKWPDGRKLSKKQKELTMQSIIAYEALNVAEAERVGYLEKDQSACGNEEQQPLSWK